MFTPIGVRYPDIAGYPDGYGFLDQGTATSGDGVILHAIEELDLPRDERDTELAVHRLEAEHLYALVVEDRRVGWLTYETVGRRTVLVNTSIDPAFRDRGIGSNLIAHVLDDLRDRGETATIVCPAVASFIELHPEFRDVVDPRSPEGSVG